MSYKTGSHPIRRIVQLSKHIILWCTSKDIPYWCYKYPLCVGVCAPNNIRETDSVAKDQTGHGGFVDVVVPNREQCA